MTGRETITVRSGAARKLLMILLSVVITATFSPALSFGADSGSQLASKANRLVTDKARPIRGIVISGKVIRHTGDGFEHLRQEAQEVLDDAMESVGKQEHYNAQVWAEINKSYRQAQELIRKARKYSDLIGYSAWGFVVLSEEIGKQITRLESLAPLNKTLFDGKGDYASLQKKMRGELAENRKIFVRSDFNDYYWDVIQDYFDETGDLISAMTDQKVARRLTAAGTSVTAYTLDAYLLADARIQEFEDLEVMEELAEEEESDEDEELEEDVEMDDEDDLYPMVAWYNIEWPGKKIYTRKSVSSFRKQYESTLHTYVKTGLPVYGYKGKTSVFDGIIKSCVKDMEKQQEMISIFNRFVQALYEIDKKSGVNFDALQEASYVSKIRMRDRMKDWFLTHYKEKNYSKKGWQKLKKVLIESRAKVRDAFLEKQITERMFTDYQKKMAGVDTLKQEQAKQRAWKNQKFRITIRKKGKGKITPGASVKRGRSFTVRIRAAKGCKIRFLKVDGKKIRKSSGKKKYTYTFKNISKAHSVFVRFS